MANSQTFPSAPDPEKKLTRLQERLMKKLGEHAHPFTFEVASQRPGPARLYRASESHLVPQQNLDRWPQGFWWICG